jgi:malate dehydrogenase (oxaloacetate-decarboxylating)(NADP+)
VVRKAYPGERMDFGEHYIIPKPFDPRVLLFVAPAVAQAAMETGVARKPVDLKDYQQRLRQTIGEISHL